MLKRFVHFTLIHTVRKQKREVSVTQGRKTSRLPHTTGTGCVPQNRLVEFVRTRDSKWDRFSPSTVVLRFIPTSSHPHGVYCQHPRRSPEAKPSVMVPSHPKTRGAAPTDTQRVLMFSATQTLAVRKLAFSQKLVMARLPQEFNSVSLQPDPEEKRVLVLTGVKSLSASMFSWCVWGNNRYTTAAALLCLQCASLRHSSNSKS